MFRPELEDLRKNTSAQAEASRGFGILQLLVDGLVKEKFLPARLMGGMIILTWSFVQGLSGLLLEGPLASMAGDDLKSAKGADARRQTVEELANPSGGALDTVPVLRGFPNNSDKIELALQAFEFLISRRSKSRL
jgi:hypothetical protein